MMTPVNDRELPRIECAKCGRWTKKIVVDVERVDWVSGLAIGFWAVFFPSRRTREFQCQHCGKTFVLSASPMLRRDKVVGLVLFSLCGVMVLLAIWLIFLGGR